jgi:hypothetical protein
VNLEERAELLGLSCRDFVALGQSDRRIVADVALEPNVAAKTRAWLAAGRPIADLSRLRFAGSDDVYALATRGLRTMPAPVAWWVVTNAFVAEIGRGFAVGWASSIDPRARQAIALDGSAADDLILPIFAHECGHLMDQRVVDEVRAPAPEARIPMPEHHARMLVFGETMGEDIEATIRRLYRPERAANALADLWGYPTHGVCSDAWRVGMLRSQLLAARNRADEIKAEVDQEVAKFADEYDRSAAINASQTT